MGLNKERLLKYRRIDEVTGCWNWVGSLDSSGRGQLNDRGRVLRVHRVAMYLWKEFDLDSIELVLHKCNNKRCFNPDHLYVGDKADNSNDMIRSGVITGGNNWKTHCPAGHEYTPENTYVEIRKSNGRPRRTCKRCKQLSRNKVIWNH